MNRQLIPHPVGYWQNFENVKNEIFIIMKKLDIEGRMPTKTEFDKVDGRSCLNSIYRHHGGLSKVAKVLGLSTIKSESGLYNDFENVKSAIIDVQRVFNLQSMPTAKQINERKLYSLTKAILTQYGGFFDVAEKLGIPMQSNRKEPDYWKNIENLRNELLTAMNSMKIEGRMPTISELTENGHGDISDAIQRHYGGIYNVSEKLGLSLSNKTKKRNYWKNFENVETELLDFIKEYGTEGIVPLYDDFKKHNRSSLAYAVDKYHGGFLSVSKKMGLSLINERIDTEQWKDFENVQTEILKIMIKLSIHGRIPTQKELSENGLSSLATAIFTFHGGSFEVASKMGLRASENKKGYWKNPENLKKELLKAIKKIGIEDRIPTNQELRENGFSKLGAAITKYHGGYYNVADLVGLKNTTYADKRSGYWQDFENVRKETLDVMKKLGIENRMPNSLELLENGDLSLRYAIVHYHGGWPSVSNKMGLQYDGPIYSTSANIDKIETTVRSIQPIAETHLLSPAQVMLILRRTGMLNYKSKRIQKLTNALSRGNHDEIEDCLNEIVHLSDDELVDVEDLDDEISVSEIDTDVENITVESEQVVNGVIELDTLTIQKEKELIDGLTALGELRLPLDDVLRLLTMKLLWHEFYKRVYLWYGTLDVTHKVTTVDVEQAVLSAYPEHTENEFVAAATKIFTEEISDSINLVNSLPEYGWEGYRMRLHQAEAIRRMWNVISENKEGDFILNADDPGMGKTASFIAAVALSKISSVLVIAPKTVANDTWNGENGEIKRCLPNAVIVRGIENAVNFQEDSSTVTFFVLHYEEMEQAEYFTALSQKHFDCLCIDEIHYIKQREKCDESQRRSLINALRQSANTAIGLTGTPLVNELSEPISLMQTLSNNASQFDHSLLRNHRMSDIADVFESMLPHIIRRRKKTTLLHLPDCIINTVSIPLSYELDERVREIAELPNSQNSTKLVAYRKLSIEAKLPYLLKRAEKDKKLLILTYLTDDVSEKIYDYLNSYLPSQVVHVNGQTSSENRQIAMDSFRTDDNVSVLVGTIGTIGVGVTLFDPSMFTTAHDIIVPDLPYTWAEFEQGISRLHREGQKNDVVVDVLLCESQNYMQNGQPFMSFDNNLWRFINSKQELSNIAIDGEYSTKDETKKIKKALNKWLRDVKEIGFEPLTVKRRIDETSELQKWRGELGRLRGMDAGKADDKFDVEFSKTFLEQNDSSTSAKLAYKWIYSQLKKMNEINNPSYTIMDMGCGSNPFASLPCRVIGLDRYYLPGQIVGKMENPPFVDKCADSLIYSLCLYGNANDIMDYFIQAERILKLRGNVFIVEPRSAFSEKGIKTFLNGMKSIGFERISNVKEIKKDDTHLIAMHFELVDAPQNVSEVMFERK